MQNTPPTAKSGTVVHVTNIPTPYRLPVYRAIRRRLQADGDDFHVFFLGRGKRTREWKITPEEMSGLEWTMASPEGSLLKQARTLIGRIRPRAVVLAWAMDPVALGLLLYCRLRRIPCLLLTGETLHTFSQRRHGKLVSLARIPFFKLADGYIAYGTRSREYLLAQGIDAAQITIAINVVDTAFFRERIDAIRQSGEAAAERQRHRRSDGSAFACHLLFVGELLPRKGLVQTLGALAMLDRDDVALHIVGSGPQQEELEREVERLRLSKQIFFHGYHQKQELPFFYAFADLLLFPSLEEIFGLVLVEGAAAGLPMIASHQAGGTVDVIEEGRNGLIIDPSDLQMYARAIATLIDDPLRREQMGTASRSKAGTQLTPERSADGYTSALKKLWTNRH